MGQLSGPGAHKNANIGWIIGRPIVASVAMTILTPILTKYFFAPIFRRYIEHAFARYDHVSNFILMVLTLSAFLSIAAYAGTSVLFGSFLAGTFVSYLPSKHPDSPFVVMSREEGEREEHKSPTFVHTFEAYLLSVQDYLMEPLFFASIGFAIPFIGLWTGKRIWRGVVYTLLMVVAKASWPLTTSINTSENKINNIFLLSQTVYRRSMDTVMETAVYSEDTKATTTVGLYKGV